MSITAISIRNFRSIGLLSEKVLDLNIFVGQNDEGKSNVLRALDLFFNHNKNGGYEFDWARDFCCFASKRIRKAEEIEIGIVVEPPPSFANRKPVIWKKTWRREGFFSETLMHEDKAAIDSKSKIAAFLKTMRYDYVPAIKGRDYFQTLMSKLHDMLEATVEEKVRQASGAFTTTINENTQPILDEVLSRLGLQTSIELPGNLRSLFAQLEFTSVSSAKSFSLDQRGDGIKVRHIPIVLRWLAEQANHLSAPGRPKTVTVWGYEEPENNLELRRCFELATEFIDGAAQIQAFVTTHSPAFYSVFRDCDQTKVGLYLVTKEQSLPTTTITQLQGDSEIASLDSSMGLLSLLEPHFKEARQELTRLRIAVKNLTDTTKPTIFCEGPTDKIILEEALRLFYPTQAVTVAVRCSTHHGGGHGWVGEMLVAWSHSRPLARAVGLFDKDDGAKATAKEAKQKIKIAPSGKTAFVEFLIPNAELKECSLRHFKVPFAIEELLPEDVWDFADAKGWLEDRTDLMHLYNFRDTTITFLDHVAKVLPEPNLRRIALKKLVLEEKETFARYIVGMASQPDRERVLDGLKPTLESILKSLNVS